jgi:hypothetical protein
MTEMHSEIVRRLAESRNEETRRLVAQLRQAHGPGTEQQGWLSQQSRGLMSRLARWLAALRERGESLERPRTDLSVGRPSGR